LRSRPGTENLDSGPLSRILATSVQVLEAVSWVITVTQIEIPKSRNSSTYPAPPPFYKAHDRERAMTGIIFQALPKQTNKQTDIVAFNIS
jgi:hypothetical protein